MHFVPPHFQSPRMSLDLPNWRYGQECSYSWSCCAISIRRMLSMLDKHLLRNLVPSPQDDKATHLPAQALTKSSDLTYPKAKGKLAQEAVCRSRQLSGLAPSVTCSPSISRSQDFTELLCTNITTARTNAIQCLRQAQCEYAT